MTRDDLVVLAGAVALMGFTAICVAALAVCFAITQTLRTLREQMNDLDAMLTGSIMRGSRPRPRPGVEGFRGGAVTIPPRTETTQERVMREMEEQRAGEEEGAGPPSLGA